MYEFVHPQARIVAMDIFGFISYALVAPFVASSTLFNDYTATKLSLSLSHTHTHTHTCREICMITPIFSNLEI